MRRLQKQERCLYTASHCYPNWEIWAKSTDYLVVGKKPGSKLAKAKQMGTEILDQHQFEALLHAEPEQAQTP